MALTPMFPKPALRMAVSTAIAFALACGFGACNPNTICKLAGPINDPSNRTLRRNIMSFGLDQFLPADAPAERAWLKLTPDSPIIGRFYPQHCAQRLLDNGDLWSQFDGVGYAWTALSRKVTFSSQATIQYDEDFRCAEDNSIYAYFDTRTVSPPDFRMLQIEQPVANLVQGWITPFADNFGRQMVSDRSLRPGLHRHRERRRQHRLRHGSPGAPARTRRAPFNLHACSNRLTLEAARTSAPCQRERDFIGPLEVTDSGRALYLTMQLDGQAQVNVALMRKTEGDASLQLYIQYGPAGPFAYPPLFGDVVQYGVAYQRAVPVPRRYVLMW